LGVGDEEPLIGIGRSHLFDVQDAGWHRIEVVERLASILAHQSISLPLS
jgi:hypothetical protein